MVICESFLHKKLGMWHPLVRQKQSVKVFSLENFPLYGSLMLLHISLELNYPLCVGGFENGDQFAQIKFKLDV